MWPQPRPPLRGWKVPYDGPVDDTFFIGPAGAAPQQVPLLMVLEKESPHVQFRHSGVMCDTFSQSTNLVGISIYDLGSFPQSTGFLCASCTTGTGNTLCCGEFGVEVLLVISQISKLLVDGRAAFPLSLLLLLLPWIRDNNNKLRCDCSTNNSALVMVGYQGCTILDPGRLIMSHELVVETSESQAELY